MTSERLLIETLLRISDKEGRDVDFVLNQDQAAFDEAMTGRDIIAKYRQGGFSTYPLGRALVRCLGYRNRRHVIIAHNTDTTRKLLDRIHYMIKWLKTPEPDLKYSTQNYIVFNKTDSSIFIGTAGSGDYGVGDTITDLHCSEVSRWAGVDNLLSGLFQAVPPSGNVLIESTGHGMGNWFHKAVMRATTGVGYKLHFFNWLKVPEYSLDMTEAAAANFMKRLDVTLEEPRYAAAGLSAGQLMWRRMKLAELNYDMRLFKENYPITLDECFQGTGFSLFPEVHFVSTPDWQAESPWLSRLRDHPKPSVGYVAGADVSAGVGQDFQVLEIFEAETGEQVLEYRNNGIEPDRFADIAAELCTEFNMAYINPERNNQGILFVKQLLASNYPRKRIHQGRASSGRIEGNEVATLAEYGTYTTSVMKALMIGALQQQLRQDLTIHSEVFRMETSSFVQKAAGQMEAEEGCHDDCVMAGALAAYVRPRAARLFAGARERDRRARSLTTRQTFEAGRAIDELVARYRQGGLAALPIEPHVE